MKQTVKKGHLVIHVADQLPPIPDIFISTFSHSLRKSDKMERKGEGKGKDIQL